MYGKNLRVSVAVLRMPYMSQKKGHSEKNYNIVIKLRAYEEKSRQTNVMREKSENTLPHRQSDLAERTDTRENSATAQREFLRSMPDHY
jgi:hypothetical protein